MLLNAVPVLANPQAVIVTSDRDSRGASWSAEYEVGVIAEKQTLIVHAKAAAHLHAKILKEGYAGLQGEQALQVFLAEVAQKATDDGLLSPNDERGATLAIDTDGGTNSGSAERCWIVRVCYPIGGGWVECDYYRVCR